MKSVETTDM